jgi:hypothetical protein
MKKLLLFALSMSIGAASYAQGTPTNLSVNSYVQPTGTVYIDGTGNGNVLTTIEVEIQNNDQAVTFPGGAQISYGVTLDGTPFTDPNGTAWVKNVAVALAPNATQNMVLTSAWGASTTQGTHNLCVSLNGVVIVAAPPVLYTNQDQKKQLCADFTFDFASSVNDISLAEISQIKTEGDLMTVFVKNTSNQAQIQIMSITGQVVKTINSANSGQNFYQEINISDLTSGVYVVAIQTENGISAAQKVFIQ